MSRKRPNDFFHRIGDRYGHFIDRDRFLGGNWLNDFHVHGPAANIKEKEDAYEIEIMVPGFDKEDIELHLRDSQLLISGRKEFKSAQGDGEYLRKEYSLESFARSFDLAPNIDASKVSASYKNGILHIRLGRKIEVPKDEESLKIEID